LLHEVWSVNVNMILSRAKPAISSGNGSDDRSSEATGLAMAGNKANKKKIPSLKDFLSERDYTGAMSLLDFERNSGKADKDVSLWLAYSAFHAGDYKRALLEYEALKGDKAHDQDEVLINLACTYFYLGMYTESDRALQVKPIGL